MNREPKKGNQLTQVIPAEPSAVVRYDTPDGGWMDGNDDIEPAFPMVTIMQPMSQVEGNMPGFFFHSDTGEITSDFDCVPLVRHQTRALFVKGDDKPLCRSADNKAPLPLQRLWALPAGSKLSVGNRERQKPDMPQPLNCAACPFSEWGGEFGAEPPLCGNADVIVVARNGDVNDLAMLRIKGTSLKPYRDWVKRKVLPRRLPSYAFSLHLETEEHVEPGRKWYQLIVRAAELSKAETYEYHAVVQAFRARIETAVRDSGGDVEEWADENTPFE